MRLSQVIETPQGRLSSKRVCGILGWIVLLVGFLVILFTTKEAPSFTEFLICATVALLGVDSITDAFKKNTDNSTSTDMSIKENGENKG